MFGTGHLLVVKWSFVDNGLLIFWNPLCLASFTSSAVTTTWQAETPIPA
jgi:hypothetical protein